MYTTSYKDNKFYQAYVGMLKENNFLYNQDFADTVIDNRYLILIPFNLKVLRMLYPFMRQTHNCLISEPTKSNNFSLSQEKTYFLNKYHNYFDCFKIFLFDLNKFKIDDGKLTTKEEKENVRENNQEAFITFWFSTHLHEPIEEFYTYNGQYFNYKKRHKECNYKDRKYGIAPHRDYFYNIKENLIDKISQKLDEFLTNFSQEDILPKLKCYNRIYLLWDYKHSEIILMSDKGYQEDRENFKILRIFNSYNE